jgi:predicted XRE-type DNA-binding protein
MAKPETYANVWDALADSPEEARNLTMRAELMISIGKAVRAWDVTQGEAAKRLGLTRPRMNDLLRSKINKFSLDALTTLAHRAGLTVKMSVKKANVKLAA